MTRLQIRTKLRRRVQEEVGDAAGGWTDTELNSEINDAYAWVQKEIYKVFPNSHIYWDTMNLVNGTSWYPLPNTFGVRRVGVKASTSATTYTRLKKKVYEDVEDIVSAESYYTLMGQWLGIFPEPDTSITAGIQLLHTPIMVLSADTDVPRVKTPIHEAIVLRAKDQVLGDLDHSSNQTRQGLVDIINDIPLWYETHSDENDRLQPEGVGYIR